VAAELPTIVISGEPLERGRQYGEETRQQIDSSIEYYGTLFERELDIPWSEVERRAEAWLPRIENLDADLAEEARGIAEGAGRTIGEIVALNARSEMVYGHNVLDGCTSFAVMPEAAADGHMWCGQNWDFRVSTKQTVVMLKIWQPPKPTVITVVEAGQVARHGANSHGLALFANCLGGHSAPERRPPQTFIRRKMLDSLSFFDVMSVVISVDPQIAANLLIAHRDGYAIDIEATPEARGWLHPAEGLLVHGNHFEAFSWAQDGDRYRPLTPDSMHRTWRLRESLRACRDADGNVAEAIESGLRDHFGMPYGVCTHADERDEELYQWETLASSVIDLTTGDWRIALGRPCDTPYQPLPWNLYDDQPAV
jgi:isopenicillin-N N-acyltransferase like protein